MFPLLFIFPGLFLIFSRKPCTEGFLDPLKGFSVVLFTSLAFWIFSYWITGILPVKLSVFFPFLSVVFLVAFIILLIKKGLPRPVKFSGQDLGAFGLFLTGALLRIAPALNRITGSVGDMTQHNDMTRIILAHDGFSKTYEPFLPFSNFGEYPLGFHTLSAILCQNSGLPFYRATQWMSAVPYALLHLAIYCILRRYFGKVRSMSISLIVLLLSHYPQFLNQWGSSTTALSAAFLFYGFYLLAELAETDHPVWTDQAAAALVLSAGFLSHLMPPVGFAFYFPAWFLTRFWKRKNAGLKGLENMVPALAVSMILILPFILNFNFWVFASSKAAISSGHENSAARITDLIPFSNPILKFFGDAAALFAFLLGPAVSVLILIGLVCGRDRAAKTQFLAFGLAFLALYACFRFRVVSFSHLFQVERIHYFLLIPGSILIGHAVTKKIFALTAVFLLIVGGMESKNRDFKSHYAQFKKDRKTLPFLGRDMAFGSYLAYAFDRTNAGVTQADMEAFKWIKENVDENAVFRVNYAEGGHLIPSFTGRKITDPHGMDVWHGAELAAWQETHPPTHLFIGANSSPAYPATLTQEETLRTKGVKLLHESGGSAVFKLP